MMDNKKIDAIRARFIKCRMFSELRGVDLGVRLFSDPPRKKLAEAAVESYQRLKNKAQHIEREKTSAAQKFGRKPTLKEAYDRIWMRDEDFAEALKLAYPDLYKEVMRELAKDPSYDAPPPPYARLYSDTKKTFWQKHRNKVLAAAALTAAAGLGYGAKPLMDRYGDSSASGQGSASSDTTNSKSPTSGTGTTAVANSGKDSNHLQDSVAAGSTIQPPHAEAAGKANANDKGKDVQPKDNKAETAHPKANDSRGTTPAPKPKEDAVVQKQAEYFTKEERDAIFEPMGKKMDGASNFTPLADDILSMCDKYCTALETKYIRPENVKAETDTLKACKGLMQALLSQLAQNGDTSDKTIKVSSMIGRLSRITLKIGTAPVH